MNIKNIAFSDNQYSADTDQSWYMQNVKFKTTTNLPINQVIANVFNGKTPTGTDWTLAYDGGYLQYEGVVKTYGDFQSYYMGQNNKQHVRIGTNTTLRTGGTKDHTGELIHSSYNGYAEK